MYKLVNRQVRSVFSFFIILNFRFGPQRLVTTNFTPRLYEKNLSRVKGSPTTPRRVNSNPGDGGRGYFRNFWVGMCRWDPGSLSLKQQLVQLNFVTPYQTKLPKSPLSQSSFQVELRKFKLADLIIIIIIINNNNNNNNSNNKNLLLITKLTIKSYLQLISLKLLFSQSTIYINSNCLFTNPWKTEKELKAVIPFQFISL